jgi:hypothetical protein
MAVSANVDSSNPAVLVFSEPTSLSDAAAYLWGAGPRTSQNALKPAPGEAARFGKQRRFVLDTSSLDNVLTIRVQHIQRYYLERIRGNVIQSRGSRQLPAWVPPHIQRDLIEGRTTGRVTRYPGVPPWGDIVAWRDASGSYVDIQVYQEFPSDESFYLQLADQDTRSARLLRFAYTQYNRDMAYFVGSGVSPERARQQIREINDECFRLILGATATIMTSAAAISAVGSSMRMSAPQVAQAARGGIRSARPGIGLIQGLEEEATLARSVVNEARTEGRVVVNVGGEGEVSGAINLNIQNRLRQPIPRFVQGMAEDIGEIFPANSLDEIVSNRLPPNCLDFTRVIPGVQRVLKPGGRLQFAFQGAGSDGAVIVPALQRLGFRNIRVNGRPVEGLADFTGAIFEAVK